MFYANLKKVKIACGVAFGKSGDYHAVRRREVILLSQNLKPNRLFIKGLLTKEAAENSAYTLAFRNIPILKKKCT